MRISRQSPNPEIVEIHGKVCRKLLAVPDDNNPDAIVIFYLLVDGLWLRMFLDAGLLFVHEVEGPDPVDDLNGGQDYLDLTDQFDCAGTTIVSAVMRDRVFTLQLDGGTEFCFSERDDDTILEVKHSSSGPENPR